jgi:hypothetical protein
MTATEILEIIDNDTNRDQHVVWGLRSIPSKSADVTVGQALDNSYIWDDGVCTDDELDGVCAIHLGDPYYDDITVESIEAAIEAVYQYHDERFVLVAGYKAVGGEDKGESIISDAFAVAIW